MGKKIRITEDELMKIISDVIREYVEERSLIRGDIIIRTYSLKDSKDYEYISSKLDEIYNIIQHGYANAGGSIGLRKKKDLLKKTYMRLAFYRDNIVAVATYNNIYGGNKMDYCAAIRGDLHDIGKVALESIIKRDKMNISEFNWVEASGKVAELFNQYGAYRLPSKYVYQALGGRKEIKIINEFEYEREIGIVDFSLKK